MQSGLFYRSFFIMNLELTVDEVQLFPLKANTFSSCDCCRALEG